MRWIFLILFILWPGLGYAADEVSWDGDASTYDNVEDLLDGEDLSGGGYTITLSGDVTETDTCTWPAADAGADGDVNTLDLNGYTWTMNAEADYLTLKNGTIYAAGSSDSAFNSLASSIKLQNLTIVYNADDNYNRGVHIMSGSSSITIDSCTFFSLDAGNGRSLQSSRDTDSVLIQNCIFSPPCHRGIFLYDDDGSDFPTNMEVYNNTFYGYSSAGIDINPNTDASELTAKNNIFYGDGTCYGIDDNDDENTATLSNNCYYNNTNNVSGTSSTSNAVTADPLLNDDYYLQAGSPCIDAGEDLSGTVDSDFNGNDRPRGSGYDIGAFAIGQVVETIPAATVSGVANAIVEGVIE